MNREVGSFQGFPTYQEAMAFVNRFTHSGKPVCNLERFSSLMAALGNPQDKLNVVHIAGTNGKGSVGRYLGSIFQAAGLKTGEYSSPYIQDYRDRIRVNGLWIPEEAVMRLGWQVWEAAKGLEANGIQLAEFSQFEITTAIGFLHFMESGCEILCLEVGLGGLLDATNVVKNPLVSVITHISLDHTAVLGNSIEEIAAQKAGIIKRGRPVVISPRMDLRAEKCLKIAAEALESPLTKPDWSKVQKGDCPEKFEYLCEGLCSSPIHVQLKMPGEHQVENSVLALGAIEAIITFNPLNSGVLKLQTMVRMAIEAGISEAAVPLRGEIVSIPGCSKILLDGAHNPGGMVALRGMLEGNVSFNGKHILVIGMLSNKLWKQSMEALLGGEILKICRIYAVDGFYPGCVTAEELAGFCKQYVSDVRTVTLNSDESTLEFLRNVLPLEKEPKMAVFAGSLYFGSLVRRGMQRFKKECTGHLNG